MHSHRTFGIKLLFFSNLQPFWALHTRLHLILSICTGSGYEEAIIINPVGGLRLRDGFEFYCSISNFEFGFADGCALNFPLLLLLQIVIHSASKEGYSIRRF